MTGLVARSMTLIASMVAMILPPILLMNKNTGLLGSSTLISRKARAKLWPKLELDGVEDELVHGARVAEADFGLGRVHIDVDQRRVDVDEQADGRLTAAVQHVAIGFAQGVADDLVAHEAAVDEDVLAVLGIGGTGRVDGEAGNRQRSGTRIDGPG